MKVDELLDELSEQARQEARAVAADPRYERLAADELPEEERAALRELAASSEQARFAYEGALPLDEAVRARITDRILEQQQAERSARAHAQPEEPAAAPEGPAVPEERDKRRSRAWVLLPVLAAAAAMLLFFWSGPAVSPLPRYQLGEIQAGSRTIRSGEPQQGPLVVQLGRGERLVVVLTPATAVTGDVSVRAFHVHGGRAARWPVKPVKAGSGAFRVAGAVDELMASFEPGTHTLAFALGRPGRLPDEPEAALQATPSAQPNGRGGQVQWITLTLEVRAAER